MIRYFLIVLIGYFSLLLLGAPACSAAVDDDTTFSVSGNGGVPLDRIVQIATDNNLPLGVIMEDDTPCTGTLDLGTATKLSVRSLIQIITPQIKGYRLDIEGGTLILRPENSKESVNQLLETGITHFRPESTTMQGLVAYLWMYVRSSVAPNEASVLSIISNSSGAQISFRIDRPASVVEILNLIVQERSRGAWLLPGVPKNWKTNTRNNPFIVGSYADRQSLAPFNCSEVVSRLPRDDDARR